MPGTRSLVGTRGDLVVRVVVLGSTLVAISATHTLLDADPEIEAHLIMEKAEVGLIGEAPGLFRNWPPCPAHWVGDLGSQTPQESSSAVRRSWFEKSLGSELSRRGCTIHLKTRATSVERGEVNFVGAGPLGSNAIPYDKLLDFRGEAGGTTEWKGAVCRTQDAPPGEILGNRADGTTEVWFAEGVAEGNKWLQEMTWYGQDPRTSLSNDINIGASEAKTIVDTIIQNTSGQ